MLRSWLTWVGLLFGVIPALTALLQRRPLAAAIAAVIAVVFLVAGAQSALRARPGAGRRP